MIIVANEAQATILNEIARLTEWITDELKNISKDVEYANKVLENGEITVHAPDTTRLTQYSSEREGLCKAAMFSGIDKDTLKLATTLAETGCRRHFTTK